MVEFTLQRRKGNALLPSGKRISCRWPTQLLILASKSTVIKHHTNARKDPSRRCLLATTNEPAAFRTPLDLQQQRVRMLVPQGQWLCRRFIRSCATRQCSHSFIDGQTRNIGGGCVAIVSAPEHALLAWPETAANLARVCSWGSCRARVDESLAGCCGCVSWLAWILHLAASFELGVMGFAVLWHKI